MAGTSGDSKLHQIDIEAAESEPKSPRLESQENNGHDVVPNKHERALLLKQDLRIVPLSAGIYLLCYLDRSNIGNAKVLNQGTRNDVCSVGHVKGEKSRTC